jgi:predicted TIM-barrel fold metal-dependent hydrolase
MIVDVNAFAGHWPGLMVPSDAVSVCKSLRDVGVDAVFLSPMDAAWSRPQHAANRIAYEAANECAGVSPVPALDPTAGGWRKELKRAASDGRVRLVKLFPAFAGYELAAADELLDAVEQAGLGVIVQTRMVDPRSHHPLAQVPDVPASAAAEAARRHPGLTVIVGGPRTYEIQSLLGELLALPNLFVDVSQADGMDALRNLAEEGAAHKLLFGSHAPFFVPQSAVARVVTDLSDDDASAILGGNAARLFGLSASISAGSGR